MIFNCAKIHEACGSQGVQQQQVETIPLTVLKANRIHMCYALSTLVKHMQLQFSLSVNKDEVGGHFMITVWGRMDCIEFEVGCKHGV